MKNFFEWINDSKTSPLYAVMFILGLVIGGLILITMSFVILGVWALFLIVVLMFIIPVIGYMLRD